MDRILGTGEAFLTLLVPLPANRSDDRERFIDQLGTSLLLDVWACLSNRGPTTVVMPRVRREAQVLEVLFDAHGWLRVLSTSSRDTIWLRQIDPPVDPGNAFDELAFGLAGAVADALGI